MTSRPFQLQYQSASHALDLDTHQARPSFSRWPSCRHPNGLGTIDEKNSDLSCGSSTCPEATSQNISKLPLADLAPARHIGMTQSTSFHLMAESFLNTCWCEAATPP